MHRNIIAKKGNIQLTECIPELDAVEYVNLRQDIETLNLFGAYGKTYCIDKTIKRMKRPNDNKNIFFSIIHQELGKYLGDAHLVHIEKGMGELGIVIAKSERGKGYGTDAIQAIIEYAFQTLDLKLICLRVYDCNPRAKSLYERLGFTTVKTVDDGYITSTGKRCLEDIMLLSNLMI